MTEEIDDLRSRFKTAESELHDAQRDIGEAEYQIGEIKEKLKELGFDPNGDLDAQFTAKGEKLSGIIDEGESILRDAETISDNGADESS